LLILFFDPEDGGHVFLRNVGWMDYTALYHNHRCEDLKSYLFSEQVGKYYAFPPAGFFLGVFFDPEDGGDMFLRNVG
jgi:hypothetical protein